MSRNRVRYSEVTLKDGTMDTLCLFYSNVACRANERDQIEADLQADARETGTRYVLRWRDEPVTIPAEVLS